MKRTKFVVVLALVVVMALAMMAPAFASGSVSVDMKAINGGSQIQATVSLPAGTYMGSDLELLYDASKLTYNSFTPGSVPNVNVGNASGKITALFYDSAEKAYGDGTVFFTLVFDVVSGASITDAAITADYVDVYDGGYNTVISSGSVSFVCDHVWGDWTQTKAPTCKDAGEEARSCSACGKTETRTVDATGKHDMVKGETVAPTCTSKGYTVYTCSGCGTTENRDETAMIAHDYTVKHITVAGDCDTPAKYEMDCSVCGAHEGKEYTDDAPGHAWGDYAVTKEATCTDKGEETATCSVCGEKDTKEIAAKGHSFGEYIVTKEATCTEKGEETATCANGCGTTDTKEIDKVPHDYKETNRVEATCDTEGYIESKCSVCGADTAKILPALGHKWGEWKVTVEATKTEKGEKVRVCEVCQETETKEIPATGSVAPKTGDEANIALYAVMFVMAGAAVVALSTKKKEN